MRFSTNGPSIDAESDFSTILNSIKITDTMDSTYLTKDIEVISWYAIRDIIIKIVVVIAIIIAIIFIIKKVKSKK